MPPRPAAARAAVPSAGHCWPVPLQETLKHSKTGSVSCGVSGSWCIQGFVWALWASLVGMGFDSKCNFTPPTILLGLLLCPWMWGIFFWWDYIQFSSVQSLSRVQLFATPWTAARQASLSITNSRSLLKLMSIGSVMSANHLILCRALLQPSIFPSIRD